MRLAMSSTLIARKFEYLWLSNINEDNERFSAQVIRFYGNACLLAVEQALCLNMNLCQALPKAAP